MRIAIFMNDLNSGGAEKIMVEFANYLQDLGQDQVTLILSRKKGPYIDLIRPGIKVVILGKSNIVFAIIPLYQYLKKNRVDVIYSTLIKPNLVAVFVGRLLKTKVIIRIANTIKEYSKSKKTYLDELAHRTTKYAYNLCHKCIAISKVVKEDLLQYTNLKSDKVHVVYNPIIIIDEKTVELESDYFHIGIVSRLTMQKNIKTICKIAEQFADDRYKIKFHFFGEGKDETLLRMINSRNPDKHLIELHGFEISYFSFIKKMDLFLQLPFWEGLGNSVLEVYNSSIPMILSNVSTGYSELIKPTSPNIHYVHPTDDVEKIVSLIKQYINREIQVEQNRPPLVNTRESTYRTYRSLAAN